MEEQSHILITCQTYILVEGNLAVLNELVINRFGDQLVAPVSLHTSGNRGVESSGRVAQGESLEVDHRVAGGGCGGVLVHDLFGQSGQVVTSVGLRSDVQIILAELGEAGKERLNHGVVIQGGLLIA